MVEIAHIFDPNDPESAELATTAFTNARKIYGECTVAGVGECASCNTPDQLLMERGLNDDDGAWCIPCAVASAFAVGYVRAIQDGKEMLHQLLLDWFKGGNDE